MGFKSLSVEEAVKSIENGALIVDVREQSEYEEAHLNNGILVPLSTISAEKITEINPDKKNDFNTLSFRKKIKGGS
jgi:rhodanese-related sulfurtransferase